MAVISEIKCGRCDRKYSGFRSRCPYCGARRNRRGKHADEGDNARAKLIIGILLLVVLIAATMVLIFTSLSDGKEPAEPSPPGVSDGGPIHTDDPGVSEYPGITDPSAEPSPSEEPSPEPLIQSVQVTYAGRPIADNDFTLRVGETLELSFQTEPRMEGLTGQWKSSDEDVFMVLSNGKITGTGAGIATLTLTVEGVETTCTVRGKAG